MIIKLIIIIVMVVIKAKQGDLIYWEMFWGFLKSALKLNFEGWEGVSEVKVDGVKMGSDALEGLYKDTKDIGSSIRERISLM